MKLFAIKAYGNYAAGVAIVRAESEQAARDIAASIKHSSFNVRYAKPDEVEEISSDNDGLVYLFESGE